MNEFCAGCSELLERCDRAEAAYVHVGPMARAIHRFKYEHRPDFARALGARLAEGGLELVGEVDRVMPVPLHRDRRIERGYDQAALLARELAGALALPLDLRSLARVRATGTQVGRGREARRLALRGAFACAPVDDAHVLLVDDVLTTGATFDAAADACVRAGAASVRRLALAIAPSGLEAGR